MFQEKGVIEITVRSVVDPISVMTLNSRLRRRRVMLVRGITGAPHHDRKNRRLIRARIVPTEVLHRYKRRIIRWRVRMK